jgi:hypothetical protein
MPKAIALQTNEDNPWARLARKGGSQLGSILKFNKGNWISEENEIAPGTQFLVLMPDVQLGDVRFEDGKPVDQRIGYARDGYDFADPEKLGTGDWQQQYYVPMLDYESGERYTWIVGSEGGKRAFLGLCSQYSKVAATAFLPVIALQTSYYKHKKHGRIDTPVLKFQHWHDTGIAPSAPTATRQIEVVSVVPPKDTEEAVDDMSDEIPF